MTFDELKQTYDFIYEIGPSREENLYTKLNLYNGCEYNEILIKEGLIAPKKNFWDRHGYGYKDPKVELFSGAIINIRDNINPTRCKLMKIKEYFISNKKIESFREYERYHLDKWVDISKILLSCVESSSIKNSYDIPQKIKDIMSDLDQALEKV